MNNVHSSSTMSGARNLFPSVSDLNRMRHPDHLKAEERKSPIQWNCRECGWAPPHEAGFGQLMRTHYVEVHGYVNENGQVFKRSLCICGKPGLYRMAGKAFCKEHKPQAVTR